MTPRLLASTALLTLLAGCSFYEEGDGTTTSSSKLTKLPSCI